MTTTATLRIVILFAVLHASAQQSTTSVPPGYCANYLNRYTKENQCIYSFIVPKQDKDDCPSMKTDVEELKQLVTELRKRQELADEDRHELKQKITDQKLLGKLEGDVQICNNERTRLRRENEQLSTEKIRIEESLNQHKIDLVERERELDDLRTLHEPTKRNYSQLISEYNNVVANLKNLQTALNKTTEAYEALKAERDCSEFNKHLPSCAVIKQWGYTKSGYAMIDPDGEGGSEPFKVYCDMDSDQSTGITVVEHQYKDETVVAGCNSAGCKSMMVNYTASMDQLIALANISLSCSQFVRYGCYDSKLLKQDTAWWVDSRGRKQTYWGGATPGSDKCACGMKQTCYDPNEVCHCDADTEAWLFDEGFLTDKDSLPVKELRFGDVDTQAGERGNFTLGGLRCKWSTSSVVPSCAALRNSGVTKSGVYMVSTDEQGNEVEPYQVRCDFSKDADGSSTTVVLNTNKFEFGTCGRKGRFGPTVQDCDAAYKGTNVKVTLRNGTQSWRTPRAGVYRITASAPSGYTPNGLSPGRGAVVTAEFEIPGNNEMRILVGQQGYKHAGSGATFVIKMHKEWTEQLLIVAGAGGSSNSPVPNLQVSDASLNKNGKDGSRTGSNFGKGGSEGQGGEMGGSNSGPNTSGGGAGYHGDGIASSDNRFKPLPQPALKYLTHTKVGRAPGLGGSYTYSKDNVQIEIDGGFGGGGSGAKEAPGGAGGYSGGGGGPSQGHSGGGGTYFNPEFAQNAKIEIINNGPGKVVIQYVGPPSTTKSDSER